MSRPIGRRTALRTLGAGLAGASVGMVDRTTAAGPPSRGPAAGPLTVAATPQGRFFRDEHGRVVTLRGVNVGRKTAPFIRPADSFGEADVERIRSWGFNLVRLGVIWEGIEPARGQVDDTYLARVGELTRLFAAHGVHVLVDMHQDLYSRQFDGDGAPTWAVYTDGLPFRRTDPWQLDYADPAVARAFDHLWLDEHDLQAAYARAFGAVVREVADVPAVVGYDLFNEPSPGAATGAGFEDVHLPRFYNRLIAALRAVDPTTPMWVEPEGITNAGKPSTLHGVADDRLALSFHNYADAALDLLNPTAGDRTTPIGEQLQAQVMRDGRRTAERLGAVPVLTEFTPGNDTNDLRHLLALADEHMVGWAYWAYRNWGTRTSGTAGTMVGHPDVVDVLVRPYAPAIAGVPAGYGFDPADETYTLTYRPTAAATRPTVLFVPDRRYPDGAAISVAGGHVAGRAGQYVRVRHTPGAPQVSVQVRPA